MVDDHYCCLFFCSGLVYCFLLLVPCLFRLLVVTQMPREGNGEGKGEERLS